MLPRKKWYTWTVLLRLVFLDKEYSSEVFQTLLAVPHFSKVAVAEVFCKKGVPENFPNHRWFPKSLVKFSRTSFFIEYLRWKAKCSSSLLEVFYKKGVLRNFAKITGKHLCQSLFFTAFGLQLYQNRVSNTGVFLWILRTPF